MQWELLRKKLVFVRSFKIFSIILKTNLLDHEPTHDLERFYNITLKVIVIN
jgi:hypothetical protein